MDWLLLLFTRLMRVMDETVSSGYVLAMAMVCMLQYGFYVYRMSLVKKQSQRFRREMEGLEGELSIVHKDRTLSRLENHILCEFVSQTEIEKAFDLLLKRFVPNSAEGFGALVEFEPALQKVSRSRGLSSESVANLRIDSALLDEIIDTRTLVLEGPQLRSSKIFSSLATSDHGKVRQLYLVAVGEPNKLSGVLITTSLYPAGASREQQLELAQRLMLSVGGNIRQSQTLEMQEYQLRSTSEMLQLRAIADRKFDSPIMMIEELLRCLIQKLGADRAAFFFSNQGQRTKKAVIRCGAALQTGVQSRWYTHEETLLRLSSKQSTPLALDENMLRQNQIDTLIRSALVAPLVRPTGTIGVLCFTKSSGQPFGEAQYQLVTWAADYLSETILRVLSHAAVERQARLDPLTELSNRREFDIKIGEAISNAKRTGSECSLLLLDLDHFKSINDNYGHQAGDDVLRVAARILRDEISKTSCSKKAVLARYGGEELVVLLPDVGTREARDIAETVRRSLETTEFWFNEKAVQVTLSVGIATFPSHATNVADVIAAADAALYQAKEAGRNRIQCVTNSPV